MAGSKVVREQRQALADLREPRDTLSRETASAETQSLVRADCTPPLILDLLPYRAAGEVIVDEPAGLHQGVGGRRPDEAKRPFSSRARALDSGVVVGTSS